MLLIIALIITWLANLWASWALGGAIGVTGWLIATPVLGLVLLSGGLAIGLVNTITSRRYEWSRGRKFLHGWLQGWGWLVTFTFLLPWMLFGIVGITNAYFPATLPRITITNGEKTVIFQSMMHIASPGFYADIRADMEKLRGQDVVFFYEGVRSGSAESLEKLSSMMGSQVSPEMYDTLARMSDLIFQGDESFADILPSVNVDLTTDEIVSLADDANIPAVSPLENNAIEYLSSHYPQMNTAQLFVTKSLSRAIMNIILRVYENPVFVEEISRQMPIFDVILDERNAYVVDTLLASPANTIYIHYGAMHYAGIFDLLKSGDPRWREVARTSFSVIR